MSDEAPVTIDSLFGGRITLAQPAKGHGYRTNVDAILLAAFATRTRPHARLAVDLGAGVGAVALSLCHLGAVDEVVLFEREAAVAALAQRNLHANGLGEHATVRQCDLAHSLAEVAPDLLHRADLVVSNPPYTEPGRDDRMRAGHPPAARERARHGSVDPFLRAMADALGRRARGCLVYPAHALLDLMTTARSIGLEPKRLRFVHGRAERPARVALLELAHARTGGLVVDPPLIETDGTGRPCPELESLLRPDR